MRTPRVEYIASFTNPMLDAIGAGKGAPLSNLAAPSQRIKVNRPIVGIRVAADSPIDMVDLFAEGDLSASLLDARKRTRVSARSPWVGRILPGDVQVIVAVPVRPYEVAASASVFYPDRANEVGGTAGGADNGYPYVKLEIFECDCDGKCGGHPPPWPQERAPILHDDIRDLTTVAPGPSFSFRLPVAGREHIAVSLAFFAFAGGTTGITYTITGVNFAVNRTNGALADMERILDTAANQPAADYHFEYHPDVDDDVMHDEIRVTLLIVGGGTASAAVKMEAR